MEIYTDIQNKVDDWHIKYKDIDKFVTNSIQKLNENAPQIFKELNDFIQYLELCDIKKDFPVDYLDAKYNLYLIALNSDKIPLDDKEDAFYDWLKLCVNSQNDPSIDFYFKKNNLDKEEHVKKILFDEKCKVNKMFETNEWQIRLRKIRTWFLKRYNWTTAIKLHRNITNKSTFEIFDLIFLRLLCGILLGFIPLFSLPNIWTLPVDLNSFILIPLAVLVLIYFNYECHKTVGSDKDSISMFINRVLPIFVYSILSSLFFSYIFYSVLSNHLINFESVICKENYPLKIIPFFAIVALSIGILIQIIWEDKTITEPL